MEGARRPPWLLRLTTVGCLLAVLVAAEYAVLSAEWFSLADPSGSASLLPFDPAFGFVLVLLASLVAVAWAAERDSLEVLPGSLLGAGLVLLVLSWLTAVGFQETGSAVAATRPQFSLFSSYFWFDGVRTPAIELATASTQVYVRSLPLAAGHLLVACGLWFETWTDENLTALAVAVESYRGTRT